MQVMEEAEVRMAVHVGFDDPGVAPEVRGFPSRKGRTILGEIPRAMEFA
jgi:hypothetical protein